MSVRSRSYWGWPGLRRLGVTRLRSAQLHQMTLDPWGDLVAGRHHQLVAAALRRLGTVPNFSLAGHRAAGHQAK